MIYEITFSEMVSDLADENSDLYKERCLDIHTPLLNMHIHVTEIQTSLFMLMPEWSFNASDYSPAILRAGVRSVKPNM